MAADNYYLGCELKRQLFDYNMDESAIVKAMTYNRVSSVFDLPQVQQEWLLFYLHMLPDICAIKDKIIIAAIELGVITVQQAAIKTESLIKIGEYVNRNGMMARPFDELYLYELKNLLFLMNEKILKANNRKALHKTKALLKELNIKVSR